MEFLKAKASISQQLKKKLPQHLTYHSTEHTKDVYVSANQIAKKEGIKGEDLKLLLIAAMFHDCGFMIQYKDHEKVSCGIAQETLPKFGFSEEQIKKICGMIMATRIPQKPKNLLEKILCDADLDYLGRDDFFEIGNRLFQELKFYGIINTEKEWNVLQVHFFKLHNYFTQTAIVTRNPTKELHLELLKEIVSVDNKGH